MHNAHVITPRAFILSALLLVLPAAGLANDVTVACGAGGSGIQAALDSLYAVSNRDHTVLVSGTCNESVNIVNFERITLQGTGGAKILPLNADNPSLSIRNSRMITVKSLEIANITIGSGEAAELNDVVTISDSTVDLQQCTFRDGVTGLRIGGVSHVNLGQSIIQDNASHGVQITDTSSLNVSGSGSAKTLIQRNLAGIFVRDRASASFGCNVTLKENRFWALRVHSGSAIVQCGGDPVTGPFLDIVENAVGVITAYGAHLRMEGLGAIRVKDNDGVGLRVSQSTANLSGVLFRNNGSYALDEGPYAGEGGIHVMLGSSLAVDGITVQDNHQTGIDVERASSLEFLSSVVTGNAMEGIRLDSLSTAFFGVSDSEDPTSIKGNGGVDLFCAANSFAEGDKAGIGKISCPGFSKSPKPPKSPKH